MVFKKKVSFKQRFFVYSFAVLVFFTIGMLIAQHKHEKQRRIAQLEHMLDHIAETAHRLIDRNQLLDNAKFQLLDSLICIFPQTGIGITVLAGDGTALFDNFNNSIGNRNEEKKPEIQKALYLGTGSSIRNSTIHKQQRYYYAKHYSNYFVRTSLNYNGFHFLQQSRSFLSFIGFLFFLTVALMLLITQKLGSSIGLLKDFVLSRGREEGKAPDFSFPDKDTEIISQHIARLACKLRDTKKNLTNEREKMFRHLQALNIGIALFSFEKEIIFANSQFIQHINIISDTSTILATQIFSMPDFKPIHDFILRHTAGDSLLQGKKKIPMLDFTIAKNEKFFQVQAIIFKDRSFEVLITDITRTERKRLLKQQMTSNIAHELKTPLASILGYLETLAGNKAIPPDKQNYFMERAYAQSKRLSHLVNDVSLLTNIEEAGELFQRKRISIRNVVQEVYENLKNKMDKKNIGCTVQVKKGAHIHGNKLLLISIFQNLIENSVNHGGEGIAIRITNYLEDEAYYYFSYVDTGPGIPEEHLQRIFERFYRIDSGRSREMGGTGLGLSIVKNAVQLHKGEISVRNHPDRGLEFLFSLHK
jgi:two-component system phosphate regulon sensor histidine kinase PhoR